MYKIEWSNQYPKEVHALVSFARMFVKMWSNCESWIVSALSCSWWIPTSGIVRGSGFHHPLRARVITHHLVGFIFISFSSSSSSMLGSTSHFWHLWSSFGSSTRLQKCFLYWLFLSIAIHEAFKDSPWFPICHLLKLGLLNLPVIINSGVYVMALGVKRGWENNVEHFFLCGKEKV